MLNLKALIIFSYRWLKKQRALCCFNKKTGRKNRVSEFKWVFSKSCLRRLGSLLPIVFLMITLVFIYPKFVPQPIQAQSLYDQLQQDIDEREKLLKMSEAATEPLELNVVDLTNGINNAQAGIQTAQAQVKEVAEDVQQREIALAVQYEVLHERVAAAYKRMRTYNPVMVFFASDDLSNLTKDLAYNERVQAQDTDLIDSIGEEILQLEQDKKDLEARQVQLAALQIQLDEQKQFFEKEIAGAKEYQKILAAEIAELSAKQQAIISARSGTYTTSVGEVPPADDPNASIDYKDQAPSNSIAVFSFGAYTHRNGMSQYGAKARAEAGRSYHDIIRFYYGQGVNKKDDLPQTIAVQTQGEMSFQQYLYGLAEMPGGWPDDALKAQAVAARSYAYKTMQGGAYARDGGICITQSCQVFSKSKSDNPPEKWKKAVDDTNNEIIGGSIDNAGYGWYSSTTGGYINNIGWDLDGDYSVNDWTTHAWETKAPSPWFYKSWYRSGYSVSGNSCGYTHPWLSQQEFSDILNAWLVRGNPQGADTGRILPITINECVIGGSGGDPYSMDELASYADKGDGAVTSISSVTVRHNGSGQTLDVKFQTNRPKEISLTGGEFKEIFNLRAPGYLRIPQSSFAFFNIEHKK